MSSKRVFVAAVALAMMTGLAAHAQTNSTAPGDAKPAAASKAGEEKPAESKPAEKKKFSKAEIEAFLTKCSDEADEKGLTKAKNKLAERKAFRRECMSRFGVEPK